MPIGSVSPFRHTGTVSVSASAVSANARLSGGGDTVVVTNTSSGLSYIRFGSDPTITATTSDMPILVNDRLILSVNSLITFVAALSPTGSGAILFSRGDGSII